jgi:hypothetical protein
MRYFVSFVVLDRRGSGTGAGHLQVARDAPIRDLNDVAELQRRTTARLRHDRGQPVTDDQVVIVGWARFEP